MNDDSGCDGSYRSCMLIAFLLISGISEPGWSGWAHVGTRWVSEDKVVGNLSSTANGVGFMKRYGCNRP